MFRWRANARHLILSGHRFERRGLSEEMRGCARILRGTWVQPREQWSAVAGGRREYLRGVAIFADVLGILGICFATRAL